MAAPEAGFARSGGGFGLAVLFGEPSEFSNGFLSIALNVALVRQ